MASFTVIYDACLLYPASIRDLVIELARTGRFRAKCTDRIHAAWINAVARSRPELDRALLARVAALINAAVSDCLVTRVESLEAGLTSLPDPDDRHVLAAAIHSDASVGPKGCGRDGRSNPTLSHAIADPSIKST